MRIPDEEWWWWSLLGEVFFFMLDYQKFYLIVSWVLFIRYSAFHPLYSRCHWDQISEVVFSYSMKLDERWSFYSPTLACCVRARVFNGLIARSVIFFRTSSRSTSHLDIAINTVDVKVHSFSIANGSGHILDDTRVTMSWCGWLLPSFAKNSRTFNQEYNNRCNTFDCHMCCFSWQ